MDREDSVAASRDQDARPQTEANASATPSEARAPRVLIDASDPDCKPLLYACSGCGQVYSPRIYACREEIAHATALQAASDCYHCRTHNTCSDCGAECPKGWLACEPCRQKKAVAKASHIDAAGLEECFGLNGGDFYRSPDEAREAGEQWVYPGVFRAFCISAESVGENAIDDHHEDASMGDLIGWDELAAAIEAFNQRQTSGSFDEDRTRIARVAPTEDGSHHAGEPRGDAQRRATPDLPQGDA